MRLVIFYQLLARASCGATHREGTHRFGVKGVVRNTQDSMILSMRGELFYFIFFLYSSARTFLGGTQKQHTSLSIL